MNAEAEKYIKDAGHVRNVTNARGKLVAPAVRYLRYNERERRKDEAHRIKEMLEPVNIQLAKMGAQSVVQARTHLNALEEDLELHSPPTDLSSETRDVLAKELQREEDIYRQGFLSHEEMRRNRVGAVDRNIRHSKVNKDRALKIKNLRLLLNPESDEQDLCNLEDLRQSGIIPGSAQHYDANAQIPGHFAMSPLAKANWPKGMPEYGTIDTPMKQAERREQDDLAELRAKLAKLEEENKYYKAKINANETIDDLQKRVDHKKRSPETRKRILSAAQQNNREAARQRMKERWAKIKSQDTKTEEHK